MPMAGPVGPMGAHGVHHIGHPEDFRFQEDVRTAQSLGIPGTIDSLVMLQDNLGDGPGKFHFFQDFIPGSGVNPDHAHFRLGKPGGLGQDFGRYRNLAEIMDNGGQADAFNAFRRQAHYQGDGPGQVGDAPLVPGSIRVSGFDDQRDDLDDPLEGLRTASPAALTFETMSFKASLAEASSVVRCSRSSRAWRKASLALMRSTE